MITRLFSRAIIIEFCIGAFLILSPLVFVFAHLPYLVIVKDGLEYSNYAVSMMQGHGYTQDGHTFTTVREPGYPIFLAIVFSVFGLGNGEALFIVQLLILGLMGWLIYKLFKRLEHPYIGIFAGFMISHLPSYAIVANDVASEAIFTIFITCCFLICAQVVQKARAAPLHLFLWLGIFTGCGTLIRAQFLLFLPFLIFWYLVFNRPWDVEIAKRAGIAFVAFLLIVGSWVLYVHHKNGHYAITESRLELLLFTRAMRAELSYGQITEYGKEWIARSIHGGTGNYPMLNMYEFKNTQDYIYPRLVKNDEQRQELKQWSINTILENPGHFLYGNIIETMKLLYLHHDYTDTFNRYFRAGFFVAVYALFLFGLGSLFLRGSQELKLISVVALLFIVYNILILSSLDDIPRYNIPYLQFYFIIGTVGLALWSERRKGTK